MNIYDPQICVFYSLKGFFLFCGKNIEKSQLVVAKEMKSMIGRFTRVSWRLLIGQLVVSVFFATLTSSKTHPDHTATSQNLILTQFSFNLPVHRFSHQSTRSGCSFENSSSASFILTTSIFSRFTISVTFSAFQFVFINISCMPSSAVNKKNKQAGAIKTQQDSRTL